MADNLTVAGLGVVATDEVGSVHYQRTKIVWGADGTVADVSAVNPLPISDAGGSLTVDGTVAVSSVSGSVTVAAAVGAPAFVRLSDGASPIATLPVSLASVPSHAVTNAGTFVVQENGAALTSLQLLDDAVHAEDVAYVAGDKGVAVMAIRQDSPVAIAADGDYHPIFVDEFGSVYVNCGEVDVTPASPSANSYLPVRLTDGTNFASGGTEYDEGATDAAITGTAIMWEDAADTLRPVSAAKPLPVAVISLPASTNTIEVVGDVAHDIAAAGNPVRIGAKAETALSGLTLVADGDATDLHAAVDGVLYVRNVCLEDVVQERTTNTDGASTAFASGLAAPGAGIRLWIKSVTICNSSASFGTVDLRDGSAGSVLWTFPVPATGGVTHVFDPPLKLTANTALAFDASAAISTITISANGFKSKV